MIEYSRFSLDNGLRVIHTYDPHTPMVALDILYNVGARDEHPELTGMAHLFEHLMFGGSEHIPNFDRAIEDAGGWDNAWTSNDFTNFYDVVPAVNAETAFWLESDRMLSLSFSPRALETQRSVVIEEFKQTCLNQPYGDMAHHLRSLLYTVHPYRYPTIGLDPSHIERVTMDDIRDFYYSHYGPNNAVLAVSGNLSLEDTRRLAERWFGPIPPRPIAPRTYATEPPVTSPREKTVTADVPQARLSIAFPMAGYGRPGYIETDIISDLLASGQSSRLHQRLELGSKLFVSADAYIFGSEKPGALILNATLSSDTDSDISQAREMLMAEALELTRDNAVTPRELEKRINWFESMRLFNSIGYLQRAKLLAMAEMHDEDVNSVTADYRRVTTEDIARTARQIINPDRASTLIYRPEKS